MVPFTRGYNRPYKQQPDTATHPSNSSIKTSAFPRTTRTPASVALPRPRNGEDGVDRDPRGAQRRAPPPARLRRRPGHRRGRGHQRRHPAPTAEAGVPGVAGAVEDRTDGSGTREDEGEDQDVEGPRSVPEDRDGRDEAAFPLFVREAAEDHAGERTDP